MSDGSPGSPAVVAFYLLTNNVQCQHPARLPPEQGRASGKLATDEAASMLMELRRLLTPTPPLVLVVQLWNLGLVAIPPQ